MGDYLDRLAHLAAGTRFGDLSDETVAAAKNVVLDTFGAILAGSRLAENTRLARLASARSGSRTATLIGHGERAEPMLAALANATAGVAFEVDEGNRWGGGHPAIHVLPAALAVAEEQRADGRRLIESLVAGYEITSRLGGATTVRPNVHSHGTWGTAGAAVAVARLLGRDEPAIRQVINLAASMSPANSWAPCFEGATIRNLYPGRAALQGILANHLLDCGYSAPRDAPSDVYGTILGERFEAEHAVDDLGVDDRPAIYRIQRNYIKLHACCLYNHPALDAIQALLSREPLEPEAIAGITVTSVTFVTRMSEPDPPNMLAAKFSVPYAIAAAVVMGGSGVAAFLDATRANPRVRELARRVEMRGDPAMSMREAGPTARVTVTLRDGRVLTATTAVVRGDAANPVPPAELVAKFRALAGDVLGPSGTERVMEAVDRLPELKDVRDLAERLWTIS
ncbi:MAG TPA: MmgE/PrpD family protein [Methylomirabilota bacterium]|nr:MmgE/PrpD family protein [Methylomirabilota bacterium]